MRSNQFRAFRSIPTLFFILLLGVFPSLTSAQLVMFVTSLEDDEFAHPWDDPDTPEDEAIDGLLEDQAHRATLRAALEEAAIMEMGVNVRISVDGEMQLAPDQGMLNVPSHSIIWHVGAPFTIKGNPGEIIMGIEDSTKIHGIGFFDAMYGLLVAGNGNSIGLQSQDKNRFQLMTNSAIFVAGNNNKIVNNLIGIEDVNLANMFGIFMTGSGNQIGGTQSGESNMFAVNDIAIGNYTIDQGSNKIIGNLIGHSVPGHFPNRVGIDVIGPNLQIGGDDPLEGNIITGNTESGVLVGIDATNIVIKNNRIGVNASGTAIPNRDGITLGPGSISATVQQNIIQYNSNTGIFLSGFTGLESRDHKIDGNEISFNGFAGILFNGAATTSRVGSSMTVDYPANQITNNGLYGVAFQGGIVGDPYSNTVRKNNFYNNGEHGIRIQLAQDGVLPPVITSYQDPGSGSVTVTGTHATPNSLIDIYHGSPTVVGNYEGLEWLGQGDVDVNGNFVALVEACFCDTIVATATDPNGNTSEFSIGFPAMTTSTNDEQINTFDVKAYPNPFRQQVVLEFNLTETEDVELQILDTSGRVIQTLFNRKMQKGSHQISWAPESLPSGVYYYKISSGSKVSTGKLVVM